MADEEEPIKGVSFSDPTAAIRLRNVFQKAAAKEVQKASANGQVARVMSVDLAKLDATVWYPGDDAPVTVGLFPGAIPLDLGDYRGTSIQETSAIGTGALVWVENWRGQPYITRIISGGEYTLNQRVAGLTHQTFRATRLGTNEGTPVAGIYERHVNIELNAGSDFTVGKAMLVGPWSGRNDGSSIDGIVELVLSFWVAGSVKNQVRKYQFSISDRMVVDLEGDEGNKAFWMRVLPETNLGTDPHAELAVDVALVKTNIRSKLEFWIRLVPLDSLADQSVYFMSVKTFGSAFNVGDPKTGRVVAIMQDPAEPVQGWLGFHNSGMGWTERDEYPTFFLGSYFQGDEWSSGSWRSSAVRAASDLRWTWRADGQWSYFTNHRLYWEGNIIISGIGPNWNALHTGGIAIPFPSHSIPVYPANPDNFSTQLRDCGGGILLNPGDTLYYGLMPGSGTNGQGDWVQPKSRLLFIVDNKTYNASQFNFSLPEWAIPIATRAWEPFSETTEIVIHNHTIQAKLDDRTSYGQSVYASSHSGIIGSDETELMEVSSMRWRKKTAYVVKFKMGMNSATVNQAILLRLKKGVTAAGADLGEYYRYFLAGNTNPWEASGETIVYNDTGADIISSICLTGQSSGASSTTWNRFATATTPSWMRIEPIGNSGKYGALGRQI